MLELFTHWPIAQHDFRVYTLGLLMCHSKFLSWNYLHTTMVVLAKTRNKLGTLRQSQGKSCDRSLL